MIIGNVAIVQEDMKKFPRSSTVQGGQYVGPGDGSEKESIRKRYRKSNTWVCIHDE